jgi:uncharacterized damage-inducible protein DinB
MPDETLLLLLKDVRNKTLRLLDDVGDDEATFKAGGLNNTILWHAGHILVVNEHLGVIAATRAMPSYPAGWFDKFSWKSKPETVTDWPELREIRKLLEEQQHKLESFLRDAPEEVLATIADPTRGRTLRHSIMHGLHDEACHQGEIYLMKKLWTKKITPI